MTSHYVEVFAAETPGTVLVVAGGVVLEVVNPSAVVEVVEVASTPTVVELITAGGQGAKGDPGPVGPPGTNLMNEDPVAWYILAKN